MSERWSEKAWVLDLRKRLTTLVALSAVVGSSLVALSFVGVLGNQSGGEGIEDALILNTAAPPGFEQLDVGPKVGKLAPDFEISDFDGTRHRLSDFRGKVVYVTFWASWCGPCKAELPDIEQLQADHPDDLVVVAVNRAEPLGRARSFLEDLTRSDGGTGVSFPVDGIDPDDSVYDEYRGIGMPVSIFINPDGVVTQVHNGLLLLEQMEEALAEAAA
ncbi:MAG: TlpA disulfide reductase family protein [Acidobacteriota bacterium]